MCMPLTYALVIGISIGIVHAPDTKNHKHRQRWRQLTWQHRHRDRSQGGGQTHVPGGEASQGSDPLKRRENLVYESILDVEMQNQNISQ